MIGDAALISYPWRSPPDATTSTPSKRLIALGSVSMGIDNRVAMGPKQSRHPRRFSATRESGLFCQPYERNAQPHDYDADIVKDAFEKIHGCRHHIDAHAFVASSARVATRSPTNAAT